MAEDLRTAASALALGKVMMTGSQARIRGLDLSMVFQEPMSALNPTMRVGDQVAEVLRLHGQGGNDYPAAMSHALTYQVCAFAAILTVLALRTGLRGKAETPPRPEKVSGR